MWAGRLAVALSGFSMQLLPVGFRGRDSVPPPLGYRQGSRRGLPCRWRVFPAVESVVRERDTHTGKSSEKVNPREGVIFTTSLHDTTLVHMCVSFTCPGRHTEGQEHGLQREKRGRRTHAGGSRGRLSRPEPAQHGPSRGWRHRAFVFREELISG